MYPIDTFKDHIAPGSTIIHDKEYAHKKLVRELSLKSKCYSSKEMKGLADSENPMYPIIALRLSWLCKSFKETNGMLLIGCSTNAYLIAG